VTSAYLNANNTNTDMVRKTKNPARVPIS